MDDLGFYFGFYVCLLAALVCYGILLAVSRPAPPKQKRLLFFIALAAMVFLLLAIPLSSRYNLFGWALAALVLPVPLFLASFYQFFIRGFDGGIAAAAIALQIMGMVFSRWQLCIVLHAWAT